MLDDSTQPAEPGPQSDDDTAEPNRGADASRPPRRSGPDDPLAIVEDVAQAAAERRLRASVLGQLEAMEALLDDPDRRLAPPPQLASVRRPRHECRGA